MRDRTNQQGATLVETVLAVIVLGIALPPLVGLYREVAARGADDTYQQVAITYAESLLEEIVSKSFEDPGLADGSFGTEESPRSAYDDVDDYDDLSESPPKRLDETMLNEYGGFTRTTTVDNVTTADPDPVTPSADGSTDCKRIRVKVSWTGGKGGELTLSTLRARVCGSTDPLDEVASAATAVKHSAKRCDLDLVSNSACDGIINSFALSASVATSSLTKLKLSSGSTTIWTGSLALPTGPTALNAGTTAERTVPAVGSPTLQVTFESNPTGTITYTLVLTFTNGTSSTITFTITW
jgi:MSHA pilin protein MshD